VRPPIDPRERATRDLIEREHAASTERVLAATSELDLAEHEADELVYELYELTAPMRALVDAEY
jgi:hypothetical protein